MPTTIKATSYSFGGGCHPTLETPVKPTTEGYIFKVPNDKAKNNSCVDFLAHSLIIDVFAKKEN